jgi:probable ribonuclease FAU-1
MIALRIRGLYAAALTQLFRQDNKWDIVQPIDEVRAAIPHTWRMDSPDVDIDDVPDDRGQRHVLRISGSADAVEDVLAHLHSQCFDVITRHESSETGALYMGLVGIVSRERRQAIIYLGEERSGVLPLRYEDQGLRVGSCVPVRIETPATHHHGRPQLSKVLTVPGQYAVLTAVQSVRMSKQITDEAQRERLQRLGEAQEIGDWGIIWRTAAQHASNEVLVTEVQRLIKETEALQASLQNTKTVGRIRGGDLTAHVWMSGHASRVCDTLRAQLLPTLPGHHKYKAHGDIYSPTVDALERELPAEALRNRAVLSVLSSINAMQQPIASTLHILQRAPNGRLIDQGEAQRLADDIYAGWVEVQQPLRKKGNYPKGLNVNQQPGDYTITRYHEGAWHYVSQFYAQDGSWLADYAGMTTPIAIFSDQIHLFDLQVAVIRTPQQQPEIVGIEALNRLREDNMVTPALVDKVREESEAMAQQWGEQVAP